MSFIKISFKLFLLLLTFSFIASCAGEVEEDELELDFTQQSTLGAIASYLTIATTPTDTSNYNGEYAVTKCFDLVYPVDVVFTDGSTVTITLDDDLIALHMNWLASNEDLAMAPGFVFPINILLDSGVTQEVMSEQELQGILTECVGYEEEEHDD